MGWFFVTVGLGTVIVVHILLYIWIWLSISFTFWFMIIRMDWLYGIGVEKEFKAKRFYRLRLLFNCLKPSIAFSRNNCECYCDRFYFNSEQWIPKFHLKHDYLKHKKIMREQNKN